MILRDDGNSCADADGLSVSWSAGETEADGTESSRSSSSDAESSSSLTLAVRRPTEGERWLNSLAADVGFAGERRCCVRGDSDVCCEASLR